MVTTDATGGAGRPGGRRIAPRWLGMALCCTIAAAVATEAAAAPACLRPDERTALEVRAVQTGLMVAALSCNFQPTYNKFMHRFHAALDRHTVMVHRFFDRSYGASGTSRATRYFTSFANRTALESVPDLDKFCDQSAATLQAALAVTPDKLDGFARRQPAAIRAAHDFGPCTLADN